MSTMYDALRKAEAEHKKTAGIQENSPETGNSTVNKGMPENTKAIVLLVAVIAVFAFAFYRIYSLNKANAPSVAHTAAATASAPAPAVGTAAAVPVSAQRAPGTYGLDGVIDSGENSMAVINGKLLKIGGTIDTLTLTKISPKEVELINSKDNSTVVLKLN